MARLKSARHHWWPRCVSRLWVDESGKTGWIKPDGTLLRLPPEHLGVIGNGHHIKLGDVAGGETAWDMTFENEFDAADSRFPDVILWLASLERRFVNDECVRRRFVSQAASDDELRALTECVVSLSVRSPRFREASVAAADFLRSSIEPRERNALIGLNLRASQRMLADSIGCSAKFAVLFSSGKEFVYGDGFFHNLTAVGNVPHSPMIVAPITPEICVIIAKPISYMVEPRLSTIILTEDEVESCNHAVQVYSSGSLFFRSEQPVLDAAFTSGKHLVYAHADNPIDSLIRDIPGVAPRDKTIADLWDRVPR